MVKKKSTPNASRIVSENWRVKYEKTKELEKTLAHRLFEELRLSNIYIFSDALEVSLNDYDAIITNIDAFITIRHDWMSDTLLGCIYSVFGGIEEKSTIVSYKPIIRCDSVPGECDTVGWIISIKRNIV